MKKKKAQTEGVFQRKICLLKIYRPPLEFVESVYVKNGRVKKSSFGLTEKSFDKAISEGYSEEDLRKVLKKRDWSALPKLPEKEFLSPWLRTMEKK